MERQKYGTSNKRLSIKPENERIPGECAMAGCYANARTRRSKWCAVHAVQVRKLQLRENYTAYVSRTAPAIVEHGIPTEWAVDHPEMALTIAKHVRLPIPYALFKQRLQRRCSSR